MTKATTPPHSSERNQFRTRWQRTNWAHEKAKSFQHEVTAERFAQYLIESQLEYGPLEFVTIDKRAVKPWEQVSKLDPTRFRGAWTDEALRASGFRRGQS